MHNLNNNYRKDGASTCRVKPIPGRKMKTFDWLVDSQCYEYVEDGEVIELRQNPVSKLRNSNDIIL